MADRNRENLPAVIVRSVDASGFFFVSSDCAIYENN